VYYRLACSIGREEPVLRNERERRKSGRRGEMDRKEGGREGKESGSPTRVIYS
jgi:hypothetical protein